MAPIDPSRLRINLKPLSVVSRNLVRPRKGERFLKGPVPLSWLEAAAHLPGKSLHAGIALWYAAGLNRSASVPLSNLSGDKFGLDRNASSKPTM